MRYRRGQSAKTPRSGAGLGFEGRAVFALLLPPGTKLQVLRWKKMGHGRLGEAAQ